MRNDEIDLLPGELTPPPAWSLVVSDHDHTVTLQRNEPVEGRPYLSRVRIEIHLDGDEAVDLLDLLESNRDVLQQHADSIQARRDEEERLEATQRTTAALIERQRREARDQEQRTQQFTARFQAEIQRRVDEVAAQRAREAGEGSEAE
jgi:hypothetical protein